MSLPPYWMGLGSFTCIQPCAPTFGIRGGGRPWSPTPSMDLLEPSDTEDSTMEHFDREIVGSPHLDSDQGTSSSNPHEVRRARQMEEAHQLRIREEARQNMMRMYETTLRNLQTARERVENVMAAAPTIPQRQQVSQGSRGRKGRNKGNKKNKANTAAAQTPAAQSLLGACLTRQSDRYREHPTTAGASAVRPSSSERSDCPDPPGNGAAPTTTTLPTRAPLARGVSGTRYPESISPFVNMEPAPVPIPPAPAPPARSGTPVSAGNDDEPQLLRPRKLQQEEREITRRIGGQYLASFVTLIPRRVEEERDILRTFVMASLNLSETDYKVWLEDQKTVLSWMRRDPSLPKVRRAAATPSAAETSHAPARSAEERQGEE